MRAVLAKRLAWRAAILSEVPLFDATAEDLWNTLPPTVRTGWLMTADMAIDMVRNEESK